MCHFDALADAQNAGEVIFSDRLFSIQEINGQNIELGYQAYALL